MKRICVFLCAVICFISAFCGSELMRIKPTSCLSRHDKNNGVCQVRADGLGDVCVVKAWYGQSPDCYGQIETEL